MLSVYDFLFIAHGKKIKRMYNDNMIDYLNNYQTIMLYLALEDEASCDTLIQELLL